MIGNANQVTACTASVTLAISSLAQNASATFDCTVPGLRYHTDRVIGISFVNPPAAGISLSAASVSEGLVNVVLFNAGSTLTSTATLDVVILVCRCDNFIGDGL